PPHPLSLHDPLPLSGPPPRAPSPPAPARGGPPPPRAPPRRGADGSGPARDRPRSTRRVPRAGRRRSSAGAGAPATRWRRRNASSHLLLGHGGGQSGKDLVDQALHVLRALARRVVREDGYAFTGRLGALRPLPDHRASQVIVVVRIGRPPRGAGDLGRWVVGVEHDHVLVQCVVEVLFASGDGLEAQLQAVKGKEV